MKNPNAKQKNGSRTNTRKSKSKSKDPKYVLTPKGVFSLSIMDAFNLKDIEDRRIQTAWELFECRMRSFGYVDE